MKNRSKLLWTVVGVLVVAALAVVLWRFAGPGRTDRAGAEEVCTLAIRCETIFDNLDDLKPEKAELVPSDGVLLPATSATFTQGESAFDLLKRVCREENIHLEFSITPGYGSAYIEGVGNIYAQDCGERSGWLYKVNGASPDVACSDYILQPGDAVEFLYSCNWGEDLT